MNERHPTVQKSERLSSVLGKTLFIWNPNSGSVDAAEFIRRQIDFELNVEIHESRSAADTQQAIRKAKVEGFQTVVAAGGDGTINSTVNAMMRQDYAVQFGVLPMGTANDFAATLGLPNDLQAAYDLLHRPNWRPIDLVAFDTAEQKQYFANVAAGGNSDRVTENLTTEMKEKWGPLCYLRGAIDVLADLESFRTQVRFDDEEELEVDVWNVLVANGRTNAGRIEVAPEAKPDDGLLDIILIQQGTLFDAAAIAVRYWTKTYLESDQVVHRKARKFAIRAEPLMRFSIDGEPIDEQPVVFEIQPAALNMIVGEEFALTN